MERVKGRELTVTNVSQDLKYVTHARAAEKKRIEKLKTRLHLEVNQEKQNKHIIFVDKKGKTASMFFILLYHVPNRYLPIVYLL